MNRLLLVIALLIGLTVNAQDLPEAYYLCGTMNDWTTPAEGGTEYAIRDLDGDGIYTGSFEIPAMSGESLEFKVFNKIAGWGNPEDYYGCAIGPQSLFKNTAIEAAIYSHFYSNIAIDNWKGGTLTVSIYPEQNRILISSPTQPDLPDTPEIYVIGSFNDWKLPDANSDNGAIKMTPSKESTVYRFTRDVEIPAGELAMKFYVKDIATGNASYWGIDYPPVTLYNVGNGNDGWTTQLTKSETATIAPLQISNWAGGTMHLELSLSFNLKSLVSWVKGENQPALPWGENIYAIYDTGDGERDIITLPVSEEFGYLDNAWVIGSHPSLIFTTENSLNPAPENCWGISESDAANLTPNIYALVKGGKPISMSFRQRGRIYVTANWLRTTAYVDISDMSTPELPDQIYLIGSPQGWNINNGQMSLPMVGENPDGSRVYSQTFDIDEYEPIFRFYTKLGDWESGSIGSQEWDNPIDISVTADNSMFTAVYPGKGSWKVTNWYPGKMWMRVTLRDTSATVELSSNDWSGVNEIEMTDTEAVYYNLQGIKVDSLTPGVLIKVQNGKSSKVIIR